MIKPPEPNDSKEIIAKLNELYIIARRKYLVQFEGGYITLDRNKSAGVWTLNDGMISRHLKGTNTYGIFNGNKVNKFITFDVDCDSESVARWATLKLIDVLVCEFRINRKDIHVSLSGGKGYHVDLFFSRTIEVEATRSFYEKVIAEVGEIDGCMIEFRPSWGQGVKIPLGIHQRTGNRCWFVDNETLTPIETFDYVLDIVPISADIILDSIIELTHEQEAEFKEIVRKTDVTVNIVDTSAALQKARRIIEAGRLIESNTRHATTFTLACFYNSQGFEQDMAVDSIMEILHNTPVDYFSANSKPDYWLKEAKRLVSVAYERNYTLGNADKPITIYKSEIVAVLGVGTFRQKQLAYAMLATSKRYGPVFYLSESTAMKMIGTTSKGTVGRAIKQLVGCGFVEYKSKGVIDKAQSRERGQFRYKPNKYRLLIDKPEEGEKSIETTGAHDVVDIAYMLCTVDEIRRHINRREFSNRWAR